MSTEFTVNNQFFASQHSVVWDSAARQNGMARDLENHRWADEIPFFWETANQARHRAMVVRKDGMKVAK